MTTFTYNHEFLKYFRELKNFQLFVKMSNSEVPAFIKKATGGFFSYRRAKINSRVDIYFKEMTNNSSGNYYVELLLVIDNNPIFRADYNVSKNIVQYPIIFEDTKQFIKLESPVGRMHDMATQTIAIHDYNVIQDLCNKTIDLFMKRWIVIRGRVIAEYENSLQQKKINNKRKIDAHKASLNNLLNDAGILVPDNSIEYVQ